MVEIQSSAPQVSLKEEVAGYVENLFQEKGGKHLHFHNWKHTERTVAAVQTLSELAHLGPEEAETLEVAAYFLYTGYLEDHNNPWGKSQEVATEFLSAQNAPAAFVGKIGYLLLLLTLEDPPEDRLGKLFLDAQSSYYGSEDYPKYRKQLRREREALEDAVWVNEEWESINYNELKKHNYLTQEAEEYYGPAKKDNYKVLKKSRKTTKKAREKALQASSISADSGARTMFKTALRNHIDLTQIADQKANIMLSINALIITIGLPAFATYLSGTSYLIVPGTIFLLTSVTTMIIATLSTRPIKTNGETDLEKLFTGKTNLFFFGNFYRIPQEKYQEAIRRIVADREYLDTSFINDLYFLGLALGDKFKYLRLCYGVFVVGLILSVVSFIVTYIISSTR